MEQSQQESEEMEVAKTNKEGLCIVHMKDANLQNFTFISNTKDKDGRFDRKKKIGNLRMVQPSDSAYRMESICVGLPEVLETHHGYHRDSYHRFTANLKRIQSREEHTEPSYGENRESDELDKILLTKDCIFCNKYDRKKIKVKGSWTTEALSSFEYGSGITIVRGAKRKKDEKLLNRIRGFHLFACEAKYHKSCRTQYFLEA